MQDPKRKRLSTALIAAYARCKAAAKRWRVAAAGAVERHGSNALIIAGVGCFEYGVSLVWLPGVWLTLGGFLMRAGYVAGQPVEVKGVHGRSGETV